MLTRRSFTFLSLASGLSACVQPQDNAVTRAESVSAVPPPPPMPEFYGAITDEPFPIPAIPPGSVRPELWRQEVANPWPERVRGTIVVDPDARLLFFLQSPDRAMRYGVSVGAQGFSWSGTARLQFRREWPRWKVPDSMIERQPELEPYSVANGGMDPGPGNPMGARALYLFQNGEDTLYRIHGGATPEGLGRAVSSGCIRMLDQDAIDLHDRAIHGADVIVFPSIQASDAPPLY